MCTCQNQNNPNTQQNKQLIDTGATLAELPDFYDDHGIQMTPELFEYWLNGGKLEKQISLGEVKTKWVPVSPASVFIDAYSKFRKARRIPHVHADLIKAWADGARIEVKDPISGKWTELTNPVIWNELMLYRVKKT